MTKIALVVGSLRERSFNRQLANRIAEALGKHAEVSWLDYADLPPMNQDVEWPTPEAVARVRADVTAADGLWFVSPEYNGSYPGHVKNLVDWLSRPVDPTVSKTDTAIKDKKVTVSGAGGRMAAERMRAKLVELLGLVGADVMDEPYATMAIGGNAWATDVLEFSADDLDAIQNQVDSFFAYVVGTPDAATVTDTTSVPAEPSEGGVFGRDEEVGSCTSDGCSVDRS